MNNVNSHQDRALLGVGLMLLACLPLSFIDASAKWLGTLGLIIWFRELVRSRRTDSPITGL